MLECLLGLDTRNGVDMNTISFGEFVSKFCFVVGALALLNYPLVLLLRGPVVFLALATTFLLKPLVTFCLILISGKVVAISALDLCCYDWGLKQQCQVPERVMVLRDIGIAMLLAVSLLLYYRYGSRTS